MNKAALAASSAVVLSIAGAASAGVVFDFESFSAGDIITNQLAPQGISLVTAVGGSGHAMIFDSSNPTGQDPDLGTPNQDFSGPGIGNGGRNGQPGQNDFAFGNILIISEDGDQNDPDDNAGGGSLRFALSFIADSISLDILDIEESGGNVTFFLQGMSVGQPLALAALGDNSYQNVSTEGFRFDEFRVNFVGSGGVAEMRVVPTPASLAFLGMSGVVAIRRRSR